MVIVDIAILLFIKIFPSSEMVKRFKRVERKFLSSHVQQFFSQALTIPVYIPPTSYVRKRH